ncbi:MAG TPA: ABC transporter ATP-binding protein [bacterium]
MSAELRIEHLDKVFPTGKKAVDDVSFTIAAGEIVALLGPSGCGKTTTLRCVAGLETPTGGQILIGGNVYSDPARGVNVPSRARNLGMVFQSYAVWPHMTVRQNVAYPLRSRRLTRSEIDSKVRGALELVDLVEYADRPVTELSGGQMQRVALARSVVYQPQLLLLDEPLSNLDAQLRVRLRDDLRNIVKRAGLTALYVTHDQAEAVVLGDRIGVMKDGKLLQMDKPEAIYNRPATLFVASFTGATNMIDGRVVKTDGNFGSIETPGGLKFTAMLPAGTPQGNQVRIALRPDNIQFNPPPQDPNRFTTEVLQQHYQGLQTVYELSLSGSRIEAVDVGSAPRFPVGSQVTIAIPPNACWAFAPETL